MEETTKKIDIFWTGGLDSTFRLIQLLATTADLVQPHYIVRHEHSTGIEIDTMIQIRRILVRKFPEVRSRFLPTVYINEDLIQNYKDIDEEIEELRKIAKVRDQYQIMSSYCREFNIDQIEVSFTNETLRTLEEIGFYEQFKNATSFKSFTYPIIELTKKELFKYAKINDWDELLFMTSFCRRPKKKKISPCGVCGPCVDAVAMGMGFRFPLKSYIKAKLQYPFRQYWRKNYLKQNENKIFKLIKRELEGRL